jgi:hypothetical protein
MDLVSKSLRKLFLPMVLIFLALEFINYEVMIVFIVYALLFFFIVLIYLIIPSLKIIFYRKGTVLQRIFLFLSVIFIIIFYESGGGITVSVIYYVFYLIVSLIFISKISYKSIGSNPIVSTFSGLSVLYTVLFIIAFFVFGGWDEGLEFILACIFAVSFVLSSIVYGKEDNSFDY